MSAPIEPTPPPNEPRQKAPIETKVVAGTVASFAAAIAAAVLNAAVGDSALLGALPAWLQFLVVTAVPPLLTVIASYEAPHTPRPVVTPGPPGPLRERGPHKPGENDA